MAALEALEKLLALERLPRTGWIQAGIAEPESVAAHTVATAYCVLALGPACTPSLDLDRAVSLALVHDAAEALLGDLPRRAAELLPAGAKRTAEERAMAEVLAPLSGPAHERGREYLEGTSREARFVRVCDKLALGVRLVAYQRAGWRGLDDFQRSVAELDCGDFVPCRELQDELLMALEELPR